MTTDFPNTYTDTEHAKALGRLLADLDTDTHVCRYCKRPIVWASGVPQLCECYKSVIPKPHQQFIPPVVLGPGGDFDRPWPKGGAS